jgi:hypothetical protein
MDSAVEVWEDEGGSLRPPRMSGSEAQVEWAERLLPVGGRYFIQGWQEIGDQVRKPIANDPRYETIRRGREARQATGRSI